MREIYTTLAVESDSCIGLKECGGGGDGVVEVAPEKAFP